MARALTRHIAATRWLQRGRLVGLYVATGSEVPTEALRALAVQRGCIPCLPRIVDYRAHTLRFMRAGAEPMRPNRHGIAEPRSAPPVATRALAVVFLPLLGFDRQGTRLGSGAGYYDRLFAFRRLRQAWHRPLLVGLAFGCQELPALRATAHDVPLDVVVTEAGVLPMPRARR